MSLKQAGISLVETLVGLSIAAGISLVLMRQQETSNKMQAKTNVDQNINSAVNVIQTSLANRAICTKSLATKGVGDNVAELINAEVSPGDFNNFIVTGVVANTTSLLPGDVKIDSMDIIEEGPAGNKHDYLRVMFNRNPSGNKKLFGAKNVSKKFRLQGLKDAGGKYITCYSEASNLLNSAVQTACLSLGGTWDSVNEKCNLSEQMKKEIVISGLKQLKFVDVFREPDGVITRTCAECNTNGCNPCPSGWAESGRSCSTGGTCGLKPRWRNCASTCTLAKGSSLTTNTTQVFSHYETGAFNCSACVTSGCNACPSGWAQVSNSCSTGGLCGFKPRWRNCTTQCKIMRYKNDSPLGKLYLPESL
jgi:hypothetical protein